MTFYVLWYNRAGLSQSMATLNPMPLIISFGNSLALVDKQIALQVVEIVTSQMGLIGYASALLAIVGNVIFIYWYFRFFHFISGGILGSGNAPKVYTYPLAFVLWGLTIVAVTQEFPFQGVWLLAENIDAVLQPLSGEFGLGPSEAESQNLTSMDFISGNSTVNESVYDGLSQ